MALESIFGWMYGFGSSPLSMAFPELFEIVVNKLEIMADV